MRPADMLRAIMQHPRSPRRFALAFSGLLLGLALGCTPRQPPTVAFLSDFGTIDDSVAVCKGEMYQLAPDLRVVDITHNVTPFNVEEAARFLAGSMPHFPRGTVFLCVVDPGVGSSRNPIVARTESGQYYVGPDNGLLTLAGPIAEAYAIDNWKLVGPQLKTSTFHGRDIFAPVAAQVASGRSIKWFGKPLAPESLVRLPVSLPVVSADGIQGQVIALDGPYGNLAFDIPAETFKKLGYRRGDTVSLQIGGQSFRLPFVNTFSDVPEGQGLVYIDSRGRLAAAINLGNFSKVYSITPPEAVRVGRPGK
jgi:S-adenosylmethionine hydrolase